MTAMLTVSRAINARRLLRIRLRVAISKSAMTISFLDAVELQEPDHIKIWLGSAGV
jgi:hypothetical protein